MAKRPVRRKIADISLYDTQPSDKYVQGYALAFSVTSFATRYSAFQRFLWDATFNHYAFIPTDIHTSEKETGVLCYVLYKTEFEFRMAKYDLNKNRRKYRLPFAEQHDGPVWFHKSWLLKSYNPKMYDTGAKQFKRIGRNNQKYTVFSKKEYAEMRKDFCFSQKCYAPTSEDCDICKNYMRNVVNSKICLYCVAGKNRGKIYSSRGTLIYDPESDTI